MVGHLVEIGPADTQHHEAFFRFMMAVFGVSFRGWAQHGGWDDSYSVFAIEEADEVVATVGRMAMRLVIDGEPVDAYQLGAIATHPAHRGRGLIRNLIRHIIMLPPLDDRPFLVFGNGQVSQLYPRLGFEPIAQSRYRVTFAVERPTGGERGALDLDQPAARSLLARLALNAHPLSTDYCPHAYYPVLLWHLLYRPLRAVHLEELDTIIVVSQTGDRLFVHDVLSAEPFNLLEAVQHLALQPVAMVEFGFTPTDWTGERVSRRRPKIEKVRLDDTGELFFAMGHPSPKGRVGRFPVLAHT